MPTYSYICGLCRQEFETFESVSRHKSVAHCPRCPNGMGRQLFKAMNFSGQNENWPIHSFTLGVPEGEQAQRSEHYKKKHGIKVDFDKNGDAILTSPEHRKKFTMIRKKEREANSEG